MFVMVMTNDNESGYDDYHHHHHDIVGNDSGYNEINPDGEDNDYDNNNGDNDNDNDDN